MSNNVSIFLPDTYSSSPDDFFWPVNRDEVVSARDRFLRSLTTYAKNNRVRDPYAEYYYVMSLNWGNHIIQFYNFLRAKAEFEKKGVPPYLGGECGFFESVNHDVKPPMPNYLDGYYNGVVPKSRWLEPIRIIRNNLLGSGVVYKPLCLIDFEKDIIVSSTGGLIFKHAQSIQEPVYYLCRSTWFKPVDQNAIKSDIDCSALIGMVKDAFGDHAHLISSNIEEWFEELFVKTLYVCDVHVKRLLARPDRLPKKLWLGSGGIFWDRIMKYAVKRQGGHVVGHDHGSGTGHVKSVSRTLSECIDCDVFVPFSSNPDMFLSALEPAFLLDGHVPEIKTLDFKKPEIASQASVISPKNTPAKILIIPYGPDRNISKFLTVPHDSIKIEFLVRIVKNLQAWGYEDVSIKPHPHCPMPLNEAFLVENGIRQLDGDIKSALESSDVVLFAHMYTTTFREAFEANKPIVLIDMHYEEWVDGAREKLDKRCAVVDGYYDNNERISIDWDALQAAIKEAPFKNDTSYYNTYYNNIL